MSPQSDSVESKSYLPRLSAIALTSVTQLVRPPSDPHCGQAVHRLKRGSLLTAAIAGVFVVVLMVWFDAWEISLMPPRGTAGLLPFRILTDFGKDTYVLLATGVMLLLVVLVASAARDRSRCRLLEMVPRLQCLFFSVLVPLVPGELVKWIVGRGRPFVGGHADVFSFVPFAGTESHASFPSAHAITAFALAVAVTAIWPRLRGAMIVYVIVIAFTRLVLLAHHPSDVVAGGAIGIIGALFVRYWFAARGLGFAIDDRGLISSTAQRPRKGVVAGPSAS